MMYYYDKDIPGPGKYNPNVDYVIKRTSKRYFKYYLSVIIHGKIDYPIPGRDIPGPGQYELKSTLMQAANNVKIGHSARNDLLPNVPGPGPAAYYPVIRRNHTIGPTFGKGEKNVGTYRNTTPGPGAYDTVSTIGTEGRKHSIYPKRPDTSLKYGEASPGPAAYSSPYKKKSPAFSMGGGRYALNTTWIGPSSTQYDPNYTLLRPSPTFCKMNKSSRNVNTISHNSAEPGAYNLPSTIGEGPKITFHGKLNKQKSNTIPGPGTYNPDPKAIFERLPKVALSTGPRTEKDYSTRKDVPGPGTYGLKSTLNGPRFGFGIGKKGYCKRDNDIPGPGAYKVPCTIGRAETYQLPNNKSQSGYV